MTHFDLDRIGIDWIAEKVEDIVDSIQHMTPSEFNEEFRYLPSSVTSLPGYMSYDVNPYMREIVDCFDPESPVREVNILKGVQMTFTVAVLEAVLFYYMAFLKVYPTMLMSADKELVKIRIENNILPMLQQSGYGDIIKSADVGNSRKTGKTADLLQWEGGGFMVPFGANNAAKLRSNSVLLLLKDEVDGWPESVGKDGCPDSLSDARCNAFFERRKILRGSTPLLEGSSKIWKAYIKGDQRKYSVRCKHCGFPQFLQWQGKTDAGKRFGICWDMDDGVLIPSSVRYKCSNCLGDHTNDDKEKLFSPDSGAKWIPTARPISPDIRSYYLPSMYSPIGMLPWHGCVEKFLEGYDMKERKVTDIAKYQTFRNNIEGLPFKVVGDRVRFQHVSAHRRSAYRLGQVPNHYAEQHAGSKILFLTMQVDVHKSSLAVSIFGWCKHSRGFIVDYVRIKDKDCTRIDSPAWAKLQFYIEEAKWTADDGTEYGVRVTGIDAGFANDTVLKFCSDYQTNVWPIIGRDRPKKSATIKEFSEFTTKSGQTGYQIVVDHYKDRLAPVLRRGWMEDDGDQRPYHFNAPVDITDAQLRELTVEYKREGIDAKGTKYYEWYRPSGSDNELWDLLVYGHALVEIIAYNICIQHFELETIDWDRFWEYTAAELDTK